MANLYVDEQNALLRKRGGRLEVVKDGAELAAIPLHRLDTVLLYGNVQFTTQAAAALLDRGIELALLTTRGRLRGQLTPPQPKNVLLRLAQYPRLEDEAFRLAFGREVVRAKIENCAALLRRFRANHPEALRDDAVRVLDESAERAAAATSLEALRGVEGSAAAAYFRAYAAALPEAIAFERRSRRPPRDPANSLLSFGYTVLGHEIQALLDAMGFDPYLGLYHGVDYGRASLALDLLEELRPAVIDRMALTLFNRGDLRAEHFTGDAERGVYLAADGRERFFRAYEREMAKEVAAAGERTTWRGVLRRQAEALARSIREGKPYRGYRLPC